MEAAVGTDMLATFHRPEGRPERTVFYLIAICGVNEPLSC